MKMKKLDLYVAVYVPPPARNPANLEKLVLDMADTFERKARQVPNLALAAFSEPLPDIPTLELINTDFRSSALQEGWVGVGVMRDH